MPSCTVPPPRPAAPAGAGPPTFPHTGPARARNTPWPAPWPTYPGARESRRGGRSLGHPGGVEAPGWSLGHAALVTAVALAAAGLVIVVVHLLVRRVGRWDPVLGSLAGRARYPFRTLTIVVALLVARPEQGAQPETVDRVRHTLVLLLIGVSAWLLTRLA